MAQMEMDEDSEPIGLHYTLPPKPPAQETRQRPPLQPASHGFASCQSSLPSAPPSMPRYASQLDRPVPPLAPRAPTHPGQIPRPRSNSKSRANPPKSKYQDRDALVSCILNDEPPTVPSRSSTPRGSRNQEGRSTPRGSSVQRGSRKMPVTAGARRSQSSDVEFQVAARQTTPRLSQQQFSGLDSLLKGNSGKAAPHMLDSLLLSGSGGTPRVSKLVPIQPDSPSDASSASSLPRLNEKPAHRTSSASAAQRGSKSARSWRGSAASLYAS